MQHDIEPHNEQQNDPFSMGYFLAALVLLLALPLMHVFLGWLVYYL